MDELREGKRKVLENEFFTKNISNADFEYLVLRRLGGNKKIISNVNFSYVIFEDCYFSGCTFEDCNFTGATFRNSNFRHSWFPNCNFSYALFENTLFDKSVFDAAPLRSNVRTTFARRLRVNFREIGKIDLENKATGMELLASRETLRLSWLSSEKYYRNKYKGRERAKKFFEWLRHLALSFLWGNGESFLRLLRTAVLALILINFVAIKGTTEITPNALTWFLRSPAVLMGGYSNLMAGWAVGVITIIRLTLMGLLLSMLVKRWAIR